MDETRDFINFFETRPFFAIFELGDNKMRTFHWFILAYLLLCVGCGYKTMPVWREEEKGEEQSSQEVQKVSKVSLQYSLSSQAPNKQ